MRISIDPSLKSRVPSLALCVVRADVADVRKDQAVSDKLQAVALRVPAVAGDEKALSLLPQVAAAQSAYRACGKDPRRYRGSAEALALRVIQGKGLYFINNVVDINNLASLRAMVPSGAYDLANLRGDCVFRVGAAGESYEGIGKGSIDLSGLPLLSDESGPFGSPTSDSHRAMITPAARRIALVLMSFSGRMDGALEAAAQEAAVLLREFAGATGVEVEVVE